MKSKYNQKSVTNSPAPLRERGWRKGLFLCLLIASSTLSHAQNSIDNILKSVAENNIELKALQSDNQATVFEMKSENVLAGPSIEYSPFFTKGYSGVASSELIVSEEFDFPTKYSQRKKQAALERDVLDSEYKVREREILLKARQLCYDIIEQNQRIDLLTQRHKQSDSIAILLQKRMDAGDANALELNKAKMERMQSAQELVEAQNLRKEYLQQLQSLNANKAVTLDDKELPEISSTLPSTFSTSLPSVQSAESSLSASVHNESISRQSWAPSITMGYRRNTEEKTSLNGFLVGMSFPLFNTQNKVKAAKQRRQSAELRLDQARQEAEVEQHSRYQRLTELRSVMDHSDIQLLKETLPLLDKALYHGQINALQYYAEYNDLYDKILKHISLHCQYLKLYAELYN